MTNPKIWILGVLVYAGVSCKNNKATPDTHSNNHDSMVLLTVKPFEYNGGWGYDILADNKPYIHQDRVPAIQGKHIFLTEEDAKKTGNLVVQKIMKTGRFAIDSLDMVSAGIQYK